ncbi:hypothetical protein KP509_06G079600 [Ceratopteris richardii]|uniref:tRNA/rRNA methyltransferase SpoU type domain-containing protein n=1 Tax=Ceratopteris richardii TaxID=49495 RepID=A0A8T2UPU0_CERRI|nr:hypothetical protein KP509_06G079600 [Ceratopteris richardii]
MSWRLPTSAPTSCVGKSVASLCSCYALHFESSTALIIQTRLQFHGFLFSRFFNLRRLCWVRRTPPFPRKSAAILDDFQNPPEKTQLPSANLSGEDVSDAGVLNAAAALPGNSSLSIYTSQNSGVDCSDRPAYSQTKWRGMLNSNHAAINDVKDAKFKWFPYLDQFQVNDRVLRSAEIIEILGPFMLEERKDKIRRVVANRTYTVCPVVEGLLDLGNIAAVFRTADAFGFQSVHVISNDSEKRYKKNRRISMGSEKWLDAELYESTEDCFTELRSRGYRIAVASAAKKSVLMYDVDWTLPTAVVFGNELKEFQSFSTTTMR